MSPKRKMDIDLPIRIGLGKYYIIMLMSFQGIQEDERREFLELTEVVLTLIVNGNLP